MKIPEHLLSTERLRLREMIYSDWKAVHEYASLKSVCQYQPWGPNKIEDTKSFIKEVVADTAKVPRTRFMFAIVMKDKNRLIGAVELNIRDYHHRSGEIGYIVHPDLWGKGVATEAAKLLIEVGFKHFHLHRIQATCDPNNIASFKVLEKIGMKKEGVLRENLLINSGWRDSAIYSVLENER
ncbi:GNAT family N-acetyltransferase [Bacillus sp. Marseille-Q1617]|uniref:GNAT family N-acetyltransferase n=1 Tax=Bacillus sp. Marseille-Q1617 TaxID=2736887 RepID=UPI0015898B5E|nr:GNAT family protein [Bacillus sp. Marseille-Q1617]